MDWMTLEFFIFGDLRLAQILRQLGKEWLGLP